MVDVWAKFCNDYILSMKMALVGFELQIIVIFSETIGRQLQPYMPSKHKKLLVAINSFTTSKAWKEIAWQSW